MEEIKILLFALVSFLSQEDIPIAAKSAEIDINTTTKQITIHQNDIYSLDPYKEQAKAGLDSLMRTTALVEGLFPIKMTSKHIYEEDGKLYAVLYLNYEDVKDLRKISFHSDANGSLSYPYMESYEYELQTGRKDGRYIRFDTNTGVKFKMKRKELLFDGIYSLSKDWKALEKEKFVEISDVFSKKDFEKLRKFILKKGDWRTFRNFDNNNPHFNFTDFDVYLATGDQRSIFENGDLKPKDFIELVIQDKGYYSVYLGQDKNSKEWPNLENGKVYWHNRAYGDEVALGEYFEKIKANMHSKE
ncbi:hypothetical protein [Costertonia aggregata]|uniref:Uncharacterized protein n=1 Tax=Costertonia aggregata TaxID=343403 RepID=A0A7H9ARH0_9FLAO|nr:hypothetical protein [Costertonia aggregata]QLG46007.1 hypothetical protein HYG79_11840 [Costertonia aggregata]